MARGLVPREILRERERRAWELRQRFYTHERIAADLELDRSTITKMLGRLSARANKSLLTEISEEKRAQVEQLRYIADEAMQAWARSKAALRAVRKTTGAGKGIGKHNSESTTINSTDQFGDPRYLTTAMEALENIRKILGLDAPQKLEAGGPIELVIQYADENPASAPP